MSLTTFEQVAHAQEAGHRVTLIPLDAAAYPSELVAPKPLGSAQDAASGSTKGSRECRGCMAERRLGQRENAHGKRGQRTLNRNFLERVAHVWLGKHLRGQQTKRLATRPVIVENRPGAINTIAMSLVAKAAPDGYVLGMLGMPSTVAPSLISQLSYDTVRDFAPVRQLSSLANVLVVRAGASVEPLDHQVAAARSNPGRLTYASGGNGTPAHLSGELLKQRTGVDMLHVPFNGAVAGVTAVLGGHVDLMFATAPAVTGHIKAGRLHAVATTAPTRIAALPDVPTTTELG